MTAVITTTDTGRIPRNDNVVLRAHHLSIAVGDHTIIESAHLSFQSGMVSALIGPNGAGKSTLIRALAGDVLPKRGSVFYDDVPTGSLRSLQLARLRSVMPQRAASAFSFTAREVVEMGRFAFSERPALSTRHALKCLHRVGVSHLASQPFPTLSGGEQALVTLARVLAQNTAVMLLDEPTSALDVRHQEQVLAIARACADEGRTVVVVLHELNLAARYADRVVLLADGKVVADGHPTVAMDPEVLSAAYRHPIDVVPHPHQRDAPLLLPRTELALPIA